MILEILIVGISLNFMGCGGSSTATMIKNRKMKNEDPCACKDEWTYENKTYWMCQDRNLDQGKAWCYIKGNKSNCNRNITQSTNDPEIFYRTCNWDTEGDPNEKKLRKELKEKSNEYSATGEGGMLDQENNQKLKENILRDLEFFLKKKENKKIPEGAQEEKILDTPPMIEKPPTIGSYVSCGPKEKPRDVKSITSCLKKKLGDDYKSEKLGEYSEKYRDCFYKNNCEEFNKCARKHDGIPEMKCS